MMAPLDALLGWDEDSTAEAYAAFTRDFPMYAATSRDLAGCAELTGGCLVVDLCGGTGPAQEEAAARRPRLPAHPHRRARQHRQVPVAHSCSCCPHRSGPATPGRATRRSNASPWASAPAGPHLRRTGPPSTVPLRRPGSSRCARPPRASRRSGRPSARHNCRGSRCAPPPAYSASRATPSAPTSAPAAHPGARVRHHLRATTSASGHVR